VHRTIRERAPVCDFSNGERTGIDDLAALIARVLKEMCAKTEGAGKAGCQAAPAARAQKSTRGSHHRFDRIDPAFPARMVLTVSFVLSLVIGLFCHHTSRNAKALSRENLSIERPGPHDFAVRERCRSSFGSSASIAARTNVRDDREAPLIGSAGRPRLVEVICPTAQEKLLGAVHRIAAADWHDGQISSYRRG
jgi:hypothetical protein